MALCSPGGVDVGADEDDVGFAEGGAVGVDAADAFFEGDVFGFGDAELGIGAGVEGDFHGAVG